MAELEYKSTRIIMKAQICTLHILYLLKESNFTTFGTSKPLHFLDKFRQGWLAEWQDKVSSKYNISLKIHQL